MSKKTAEVVASIYVYKGSDVHQRLAAALMLNLKPDVIDTILNQCPDMECSFCGTLMCPRADPFHFHHDGCPTCEGYSLKDEIPGFENI